MIFKLLTIILLLIGSSSISLKENISKEEIAYFLENNINDLNKELKNEGYDIILYEAKSYNIKIVMIDNEIDGMITLFDDGMFYFTYSDNYVLYDYGDNFNFEYISQLKNNELVYHCSLGYINPYYNCSLDQECFSKSTSKEGFDEFNGTVCDSKKYILSRYGKNCTLKRSKKVYIDDNIYLKLPNLTNNFMQGFSEYDYSCYIDSNDYSEGNCGLVSAYTIAYFWMKRYHKEIKCYDYVEYIPKEEETSLYNSKLSSSKYHLNDISIDGKFVWPELYVKMRKICYERYGKVENLSNWDSSTIIERTLKEYNVNVDSIEETAFADYINVFPREIESNRPVLLGVLTSSVYKNHLMAISGYQIWEKVDNFLFFKTYNQIVLAEVRDGWSTDPRYFNFNTYVGAGCFCRIKEY